MTQNNQPKVKFKISCCSFPLLVGFTGAFCMSWYFNHSITWGIFHGFLNWFYLAYKTMWYFVTNM